MLWWMKRKWLWILWLHGEHDSQIWVMTISLRWKRYQIWIQISRKGSAGRKQQQHLAAFSVAKWYFLPRNILFEERFLPQNCSTVHWRFLEPNINLKCETQISKRGAARERNKAVKWRCYNKLVPPEREKPFLTDTSLAHHNVTFGKDTRQPSPQ